MHTKGGLSHTSFLRTILKINFFFLVTYIKKKVKSRKMQDFICMKAWLASSFFIDTWKKENNLNAPTDKSLYKLWLDETRTKLLLATEWDNQFVIFNTEQQKFGFVRLCTGNESLININLDTNLDVDSFGSVLDHFDKTLNVNNGH